MCLDCVRSEKYMIHCHSLELFTFWGLHSDLNSLGSEEVASCAEYWKPKIEYLFKSLIMPNLYPIVSFLMSLLCRYQILQLSPSALSLQHCCCSRSGIFSKKNRLWSTLILCGFLWWGRRTSSTASSPQTKVSFSRQALLTLHLWTLGLTGWA